MQFLWSLAVATLVSADAFSISVFAPNTDFDGAVLHGINNCLATKLEGPSCYCPLTPESSCPKVAGTLVTQSTKAMAMAVQVPGGQSIYVHGDNGQVKYSTPHSNYIPPGSIGSGWYHKIVVSECLAPQSREVIDFDDGNGHSGLVLCPSTWSADSLTLYAKSAKFSESGCHEIGGLSLIASEYHIGCWEYL
ncbi:hypothetical protein GQX73_g934 [Xylaria multiplex]|uniref:Uncharacterized protein n=1 Tax=Xylaria multiplex TaxID=323545 RepID=A0A7C8IX10_9PEZI|nr:hypothetical protein GQX73_g934 [Xylaria multiplex]